MLIGGIVAAKRRVGRVGLKAARATPGKRRSAVRGVRLGAGTAKRNAHVQALLHNERVRERLGQGLKSARIAYLRATRRGDAAEALLEDRRSRRELRRAIASFGEAAATVREAKARRQRRAAVRVLVPVAVLGAAGALAANAAVREKVLARVSGSKGADGAAAGAGEGAPDTSGARVDDEPVRGIG
jgi:hypothetical protein